MRYYFQVDQVAKKLHDKLGVEFYNVWACGCGTPECAIIFGMGMGIHGVRPRLDDRDSMERLRGSIGPAKSRVLWVAPTGGEIADNGEVKVKVCGCESHKDILDYVDLLKVKAPNTPGLDALLERMTAAASEMLQ